MRTITAAAVGLLLLTACASTQLTEREAEQRRLQSELLAGSMNAPSEEAKALLLKQCQEAATLD
jgi:hypothetical protein